MYISNLLPLLAVYTATATAYWGQYERRDLGYYDDDSSLYIRGEPYYQDTQLYARDALDEYLYQRDLDYISDMVDQLRARGVVKSKSKEKQDNKKIKIHEDSTATKPSKAKPKDPARERLNSNSRTQNDNAGGPASENPYGRSGGEN